MTDGIETPRHPEESARIDFLGAARLALGDAKRQAAMGHAMATFRGNRAAVLAHLPEWEAWREEARAVKARTLAHLDTYLDRLDRNVRAVEEQVH